MASPIQHFRALQTSLDFMFVVYYRGHWCPFCRSYLKDFQSLTPAIKAAGGTPLIITSEEAKWLPEMRELTGYDGEAIVDTENFLVNVFKSRGLLDVVISERSGYPHGMAQPAVLVVDKNGKKLANWAIIPNKANLGGAKDRPALGEIWEDVQAIQRGSKTEQRQVYTKLSFFTGLKEGLFGRKPVAAAA